MNKEFLELLDKSKKIHETKNQDYTSGNVDENFERMAWMQDWFNTPIDKVFATMVAVKLARLATLLNKSTTPKHESVDDSFLDLFTYVGLWGANYTRRRIKEGLKLFFNDGIEKSINVIKDLEWDRHSLEDTCNQASIELANEINKNINPKEQKLNELINMYDQLTDADYAQILSTARILTMRKS